MRKLLFILISYLFVNQLSAQTFTNNGINYEQISSTTVEVVSNPTFAGVAVVPLTVNYNSVTYNVVSVRGSAFINNTTLTELYLPASIATIGANAFSGCSNLRKAYIPGTITLLNEATFMNCTKLVEFPLPASLITMGISALENCSALTSVDFPSSLTNIGEYAFKNCTAITTMYVPWQTPISFNSNAFENITKSNINLYVPLGRINAYNAHPNWTGCTVRPNSGLILENGLYYNIVSDSTAELEVNYFVGAATVASTITKNSITFTVTKIVDQAFFNATGLTTVTIPNTIKVIGFDAFASSGITSVVIPNSVNTIGNRLFYNCSNLTSVTLPNTLPSINNYMFHNCTSLTSITIPNSVTSIGEYAFFGCNALTTVNFPTSLLTIGTYAFFGCSGLTELKLPVNLTTLEGASFGNCTGVTNVEIPGKVSNIMSYAFYGLSGLTTMTVGAFTPVNISTNVFDGLTLSTIKLFVPPFKTDAYQAANVWTDFDIDSLNSYTVGNVVYTFTSDTTVLVGKNPSFTGALTLPYKISYVGNLYKVVGIVDSAFYKNNNITSIQFSSATASNAKISSTSGSDNPLKFIGAFAFYQNTNLALINLPSSITTIGDSAFAKNTGLSELIVHWVTPLVINTTVFGGVDVAQVDLTSPSESASLYAQALVWKDFGRTTFVYPSLNQATTQIYPNPSQSKVHILVPETPVSLEIVDLNGLKIRQIVLNNLQTILDIEELNNGIYFFKFSGNQYSYIKHIVNK